MAWATKYRCEFKDTYGTNTVKIDFEVDGYGGSVISLRPKAEVFEIQTEEQDWVVSSEMVFSFIVNEDNKADYDTDFFDTLPYEVRVKYYLDDSLKNVFWLKPANSKREYFDPEVIYQISATDGLNELTTVDYEGYDAAEEQTVLQIIKNALDNLNISDLDFYIQCNLYEDLLMMAGDNVFQDLYANNNAFYKMENGEERPVSCYEVLSRAVRSFYCTLHQDDGYWKILNGQEYVSECDTFDYATLAANSAGVAADRTVTITSAKRPAGNKWELSKRAPIKNLRLTLRNKNLGDNELTNGNFASGDTTGWNNGPSGSDWDTFQVVSGQLQCFEKEALGGDPNSDMYFESDTFYIDKGDGEGHFEYQFDLKLHDIIYDTGNYTNNPPYVRIRLVYPDNSYAETPNVVIQEGTATYTTYNTELFPLDQTGDYKLRIIYHPHSSADVDTIDLRFDNIEVTQTATANTTFDKLYKNELTADAYNQIPIELFLSDSLQRSDIAALTDAASSGNLTSSWTRYGASAENLSLPYLFAQQYLNDHQRHMDMIDAEILDVNEEITVTSILIYDGKYYRWLDYNKNYYTKLISGTLLEVDNATDAAFDHSIVGLTSIDGESTTSAEGAASFEQFWFRDTASGIYTNFNVGINKQTTGSYDLEINDSLWVGGQTTMDDTLNMSGSDIILDNTQHLKAKDIGGTAWNLLGVQASDMVWFGNSGLGDIRFQVGTLGKALVLEETTGHAVHEGNVFIAEGAAAGADKTAYGQLWVKNDTPNALYFTTDAGNDREIAYAGGAFHDGFSDYAANDHVDHSTVSIIAGVALTGGGDITTSRTLNVDESAIDHDNLLNYVGNQHVDHTLVAINTQHSLSGGGTIAATRTLNLVNDEASPGNNKVYGTDGAGTRGWQDPQAGYWTQTGSDIYYTTGKVWIGTNTGSGHLEIEDTSTNVDVIIQGGTNDRAGINMYNDAQGWAVRTAGNDEFYIYDLTNTAAVVRIEPNAGADVLHINSTGQVGIGTNAQNRQFQVYHSSLPRMGVLGDAGNEGRFLFGDGVNPEAGSINYDHSADEMWFERASAEKMRIKSDHLALANGILLADTSTASAGMIRWTGTDFQGYDGSSWNSFATSGTTAVWSQTGNDAYYTLGNVGIGQQPTTFELEVADTGGNAYINIISNTGAYYTGLLLGDDTDAVQAGIFYSSQSQDLLIRGHDNTTVIKIDSSGNVNIPTDSTDVLNFTANSTNDQRGIAFNDRTALSADYNDNYLRLNQGDEFSSGVYTPGHFRTDGNLRFGGSGTVLRYSNAYTYGLLEVTGGSKNSFYAINFDGGSNIMSRDSDGIIGFYDTTNSKWMMQGNPGGRVYLYYDGSQMLSTESYGVQSGGGILLANTVTASAGMIRWTGSAFEGYDGSSWLDLGAGGVGGGYLPLAGGTMGGAIDMDNNSITNANSLSINDPGEGITFSGGSLGNFILEMRDEAVDNMMELFSNTSSDTEFNIHNTGAGDMSVGINTDTPSEALHVVGSIRSTDLTASRALVSGANGVIESSSIITTTELGYLNGVTSNIQDQLDAIGNTIDGSGSSNKVAYWSDSDTLTYHGSITATELGFLNGATSNIQQQIDNLDSSTIDGSGSSNKVAYWSDSDTLTYHGSITSTELGYLNGVSSNIQNQLDGKEPTLTKGNLAASGPISLSATRQVIGGGATISISQAGISSDGYLSSTDWNRFNDVAIGAGSIAMLGAAFLVSTQSTGSTTLYTVPSWKYCFLTHVIIDAENDQTGAKVNIGKSGQYEWTNISLDALTSLHDWAMINHNFSTTPAANQMYSGGDNIIINVHSGTGVSSSINVWLFGFIRE